METDDKEWLFLNTLLCLKHLVYYVLKYVMQIKVIIVIINSQIEASRPTFYIFWYLNGY